MPVFESTEQLYEILGTLFNRVKGDPDIAQKLVEGNIVVRFRFTDPDGEITFDLRQTPISITIGESDLKPNVEMIQSGDIAHQFWLGRVNIARAIATRQVIPRGSVPKALALLPAIKPAYDMYPEVLRDLGYEALIPIDGHQSGRAQMARQKRGLSRLFNRESALSVDLDTLNAHYIPLMDEVTLPKPVLRPSNLPTEETALKVEMLRRMQLIRIFEQTLSEVFLHGEVPTETIHLSIGQEATAVGVCFALDAADYLTTTHRGHGHMLAKGVDLHGMMAELLGKQTGLCQGKGGSMHVTDSSVGALGANGIVGAPYLIAAGAGLSILHQAGNRVSVAFSGDGATNQGMFHEALNFAAVFKLPVIFIIENNLYGEFTSLERHAPISRLSDRAASYGMPGITVDGNDVWAVYEAAQQAVSRAREGEGPTLLECLTYSWHGHMEGEDVDYRDPAEIEAWKQKDPIKRLRAELIDGQVLTTQAADEIEAETAHEIQQALDQARADAEPPLDALVTDIFSPDHTTLFQPASPLATTRERSFSQALFEAIAEEMSRDSRVFLLGEDVSTGGYFAVTAGMAEEFGQYRVLDTPISENAIVGSAVGAAMTGMRPIVEILFSDFLTTCMDPIVNQAAKLRYMSGGQYAMPLVVRTPGGGGIGMAAQHSQSLEAWLTGIPGLIIVVPGTPYDAKGLLKASIRSNNPVIFFENKLLYTAIGPVPEEDYIVPLGVADIKREGRDVSLVAIGAMVIPALEAADQLAAEGLDVEVIDPRTLIPCDWAAIVRSVVKTGRLVVAEPGVMTHGFGAEVISRVVDAAMPALKAAPRRVAGLDVPIPYNRTLEVAALPDTGDIVKAVRALMD